MKFPEVITASILSRPTTGRVAFPQGGERALAARTDLSENMALDRTNQAELDDTALIKLTLAGRRQSFEQLVRRYQKLVYNLLLQMVRHHETAADLTQETFLKAFKGLSTFRLDARFKPWLLRIATNTGLNFIRDARESDSLDACLDDNPQLEPASRQDVEEEVEWRLSQAMLSEVLATLSARHRHVFLLRYQHDLSYEDISLVTGQPETTIKALLFRIRDKLRRTLLEKMRS